jgi:hypothetical protein
MKLFSLLIDLDAVEEAISSSLKSVFHSSGSDTLVFTLYIWQRKEIENLSDVSVFQFNIYSYMKCEPGS